MPADLRGRINDAIQRFALYGEEPAEEYLKYTMFAVIRNQILRDREKYKEICIERQKAAEIRWENEFRKRLDANDANAYETMQMDANDANDANKRNKTNKYNITLREKESTKEKTQQVRFTPPTLDEVVEFITTNGYTFVNAEAFYNHYESIGWKVGRNPMKDWHAAVRGWNSRDKQTTQQVAPTPETPRKKDLPLV